MPSVGHRIYSVNDGEHDTSASTSSVSVNYKQANSIVKRQWQQESAAREATKTHIKQLYQQFTTKLDELDECDVTESV